MDDARVVLVHGLWHGGWCWDEVRTRLTAAGISSEAVELPMATLDGDVQVLRGVLDAQDGLVVLAGHSYGGAVVTAGGDHPMVRQLAYIAAFALGEGESISRVRPDLALAPGRLGDALRFDREQVSLDPDLGRELLYHDVAPAIADAAVARWRPVGRALFSARPSALAWQSRPATYAVCTADRVVAPDLQRAMAERTGTVLEWPTGHTPLLGRPDLVSELVTGLVVRAAR